MENNEATPVEASKVVVPTIEKSTEKKNLTPIIADADGQLIGSTFEEQFRLARAYHASGLMPQGLNSPEKVMVAVQMCRELNLPPMSSISKIAVINGTASLFGDLPLALVQRSGLLESIEESIQLDEQGREPVSATCVVKRKGVVGSTSRSFTQDDAKRAGLWGKKVWAPYPKRMMQMRARSHALKDTFADVLMGVQILEYDHNGTVDDKGDVVGVETKTIAQELNETYTREASVSEEKTNQKQGESQ